MRNIRFVLFLIIGILIVTAPVYGAGIVPCGGTGQGECRACDFVKLGQNLINWFIAISASTIALTFAVGGMKMVMSGGDTGAVSSARTMMTNSVIGLIIILGSWLIVDSMLKLFLNDQSYGVWNEVQCVSGPVATTPTPPVVGAPSGNGPVATGKMTDTSARELLKASGVDTKTTNTSLEGINAKTVQDAIDLKKDCNCTFIITGGTEGTGGHANGTMSHGTGYKYDIRPNDQLNNYIEKTSGWTKGTRNDGGTVITTYTAPDGNVYAREGDHWDVLVKS